MKLLDLVNLDDLEDLLVASHGEEVRNFARYFNPSQANEDFFEFLVSNQSLIQDAYEVHDIGANNGFWSWVCLLLGANVVRCIEPREKYVNGMEFFAKKHNINLDAGWPSRRATSDYSPMGCNHSLMLMSDVAQTMPNFIEYMDKSARKFKTVLFRSRIPGPDVINTCNGVGGMIIEKTKMANERRAYSKNGDPIDVLANYDVLEDVFTFRYTAEFLDMLFESMGFEFHSYVKNQVYFACIQNEHDQQT